MELVVSFKIDFYLKLCALHFIFPNLLVHTHAQDILGALLGGVQDGINLLNNNLGVGHRDYPDYEQPTNRDVSFSQSNEVPQSNENDSEEPYNSNSDEHQGDDSSWNSKEYDRRNPEHIENQHQGDDSSWNLKEYDRRKPEHIENKKKIPIHNQIINNNQQTRSPTRNHSRFKGNFKIKPNIGKPALLENQKPLSLEKERLESNNSVTENKDNFNPLNVTTIINNLSSTTPVPLVFPSNGTVVDKKLPNLSEIDSSLNQNTLNSTQPATNLTKTIEKDNNKYVLKSLTKKKFFFQAKPVIPLSEEVSANETIYYIDLD